MPHIIEPAASARSKCRGCGQRIAKDELRFGERLENPYGEGEMTLWFHPVCGVYKRPEPFLEVLAQTDADLESIDTSAAAGHTLDWLHAEAATGLDHRRLPRLDGAGAAPTGRARCRSCREPIEKDSWRLGLVYYEEGFFNPSGFIHAGCAREYFEAAELAAAALMRRVRCFSPDLEENDLAALEAEIDRGRSTD